MRANRQSLSWLRLLCGCLAIGAGCEAESTAPQGQHTNGQQGQVTLKGSLARTREGILESFDDRRGTWQPDGQITQSEWVTFLGEADEDQFVLVKPRAELDIVRRMHLSQLQVEGKSYDIPLVDSARHDVHCPIHPLGATEAATQASHLALMPGDIASSYRWVIGPQGDPIGFVSRYCSGQERALPNSHSLHALGAMAKSGAIVLSQEESCTAGECYGFELESTSLRIVDYYRTNGFSEPQWLSMTRQQKEEALDNLLTGPYQGVLAERLSRAPVFLSKTLAKERHTIWEATSIMPQPSVQQMLAQMGLVRDLFESRWSVHLHVSFPLPELQQVDIDRLRHLAYVINEYLALRVYAHDVPAVLHPFTGPSSWESSDTAARALMNAYDRATPQQEFKYHFVALRCRDPYGNGRCGFEIRRTVAGLPEQLWLLERLKDFWAHPSAGLLLHNPVPLLIDSEPPASEQVLSADVWKAFQLNRPALAFGLKFASPTQSNATPLYEIAMLPLIDWQARLAQWQAQGRLTDAQAAELSQREAAARDNYLNDLSAAIIPQDGNVEGARIRAEVALALHHWAQQTELWKYY